MRRLVSIAAIVLTLALAPAFAQRGGGHASGGGGHASFGGHSGGFGGHVGGGVGGMRGGSGFHSPGFRTPGFRGSGFHNPGVARRGFVRSPYLHSGLRQPTFRGDRFRGDRFRGDRFRGDRFRDRRFRNFGFRNCFGFNCGGFGWPWWWAGYDPWWDSWWWDSGSSYDEDRANEVRAANEMNQQSLEEERARRDEDQDLYARQDPVPQQREVPRAEAPTPATVLVFRDQHKQEVQNYAIVGPTLWAFASQRTQKIPLSGLDIAATTKANEERGVDFRIPGSGEGQ